MSEPQEGPQPVGPVEVDPAKETAPPGGMGSMIKWGIVAVLVVVVAVVGYSRYQGYHQAKFEREVEKALQDLRSIGKAVEGYKREANRGRYPETQPLIARLPEGAADDSLTSAITTWDPTYFRSNYTDPFSPGGERPYVYLTRGDRWILLSTGPDGDYDLKDVNRAFSKDSIQYLNSILFDVKDGPEGDGDIWHIKR